ELIRIHKVMNSEVHENAQFLPWHRQLLRDFEYEMELAIKTIEPNYRFALPYWDSTLDSQAPETSPLLQPNIFGNNGDQFNNYCLTTGPGERVRWGHWFPAHHDDNSCVQRYYGNDFGTPNVLGAFYPPGAIQNSLQTYSDNYWYFNREVQFGFHAKVHANLGGDMANVAISPNDPIFFLHHAFVDKVWNIFQNLKPENKNMYFGPAQGGAPINPNDPNDDPGFGNSFPTDLLSYFGIPVSSVFDTYAERLCYKYSNYGVVNSPQLKEAIAQTNGANNLSFDKDKEDEPLKKVETPDSVDRTEPNLLRDFGHISEDFILKMGWNLTEVRAVENRNLKVVKKLNILIANKKYDSPVKLGGKNLYKAVYSVMANNRFKKSKTKL
ncbi:hypothetical protein HK099_004856, partial [Clydaea vesicula]